MIKVTLIVVSKRKTKSALSNVKLTNLTNRLNNSIHSLVSIINRISINLTVVEWAVRTSILAIAKDRLITFKHLSRIINTSQSNSLGTSQIITSEGFVT